MTRPSSLIDTRIIYCGDCLDQLRKLPAECVDLIYIDPPFNSNRNYEVFWGETKEKRAFEDRHESTKAYIEFMRPRCVELARVLKKTGSFYYHCDWHASHYVKVMLDQILGENNFQSDIIWRRTLAKGLAFTGFPNNHDTIFLYGGGGKLTFDRPYNPYDSDNLDAKTASKYCHRDPDGRVYRLDNRIVRASSNEKDIVLDAFCGCGTALVASQNSGRQWIGIDISPTACRVMADRLRKDCKLLEDEKSWRAGRGFVVRDLPWTEAQLRKIPPFEFENWAVIALGGIGNKAKVGDMVIDGRIYPVAASPKKLPGTLDFMDQWYPIQVKQKDKVGRPDIDAFEAMMMREDRVKGFYVSFAYTSDALSEISAFFRKTGKVIVPFTVNEILDDQIAQKLV